MYCLGTRRWHLWKVTILPPCAPVKPRYLPCLPFGKLLLPTQYLGECGSLKIGCFLHFSVSVLGVKLVLKWYFLGVVLEVPLKAQVLAQEIFRREALIFSFYLATSLLTFGKGAGECLCKTAP